MSRLLGANPHKASNDLFSVNFNQDASCVAVGTRTGYSITNCEPFGKVYSKSEQRRQRQLTRRCPLALSPLSRFRESRELTSP